MTQSQLTATQIANALVRTSQQESFEVAVVAACTMVYDHWRDAEGSSEFDDDSLRTLSGSAKKRMHYEVKRLLEGADTEKHRQVFEELLVLRAQRLDGAGLRQGPTPIIADLMAALVGKGASILDPACGIGTCLLAVGLNSPDAELVGFESNTEAARLAAQRLALAGISARIHMEAWKPEGRQDRWDGVVVSPPPKARQAILTKESGRTDRREFSWSEQTQKVLSKGGRACILLPAVSATRAGAGARIRRELIASGRLQAIIELPAKSIHDNDAPSVLWVSGPEEVPHMKGQVLVANMAAVVGADQFEWDVAAGAVHTCVEWLQHGTQPQVPEWLAQTMSVEELLHQDTALPSALLERREKETDILVGPGTLGRSERLLTRLKLANFKSIGHAVSIPLSPLTLIFGKNSAGKSSVLQSILLMKQSVGQPTLNPYGPQARLGSYAGLVHGHDLSLPFHWGITFAPVLGESGIVPAPGRLREIDVSFHWDSDQQAALPQEVSGVFQGRQVTWTLDSDSQSFRLSVEALMRLAEIEEAERERGGEPGSISVYRKLGSTLESAGLSSLTFERNGLLPATVADTDLQRLKEAHDTSVAWAGTSAALLDRIGGLVSEVGQELGMLLDRVVYLGPLRQAPTRISQRGMVDDGLDIPFHLLHNVSQRRIISQHLQDLGMHYRLDAVPVVTPSGDSLVGELAGLVLTDSRTGVRLSPSDVGFGVSQVLPIIVELAARRQSIIMVEQPEIHLHPGMQAELADLFIDSVNPSGNANQVIVETHSENLVLRLQRRIKDGTIDADDVSIIYIDQNHEGKGTVRRLRLDDSGDFLDEWPHGFFVEQFEELFGEY
ncbi:DUF3696 domain-containing protein [Actinomycetaceae bacterium WB03_NA08]|uniref:DUF3696 domain-containing protein n=1 Tax=Scrofimicrobium canadense TaxID=2652290 RepID=A0A6N7VSV9_9ACTO|nr:DUF3696 domain-containing protein [Scrofimicrobium canadense]MSS84874.1 DUF3696 domain-containing protein [Scrofimicrobium canadense]